MAKIDETIPVRVTVTETPEGMTSEEAKGAVIERLHVWHDYDYDMNADVFHVRDRGVFESDAAAYEALAAGVSLHVEQVTNPETEIGGT